MIKLVLGFAVGIGTSIATAETFQAIIPLDKPALLLCVPPWCVTDAFGATHCDGVPSK